MLLSFQNANMLFILKFFWFSLEIWPLSIKHIYRSHKISHEVCIWIIAKQLWVLWSPLSISVHANVFYVMNVFALIHHFFVLSEIFVWSYNLLLKNFCFRNHKAIFYSHSIVLNRKIKNHRFQFFQFVYK